MEGIIRKSKKETYQENKHRKYQLSKNFKESVLTESTKIGLNNGMTKKIKYLKLKLLYFLKIIKINCVKVLYCNSNM